VSSIPLPTNEDARLAALDRLSILDTEPEDAFDRITTLAQHIFDVPSAAISFVDRDRQWFKSMCGWDVEETPRDHSFCTYTILDDAVTVVEDVGTDDRFRMPTGGAAADIQFYAGAPLTVDDDLRVGALCLMDTEPRAFTEQDRHTLSSLADVVVDLVNARHRALRMTYLYSALEEAQDSVVVTEAGPLDDGPRIVWVNKAFSRMTGYDRDEIVGETPRILQGPDTSRSVLNKVRSALENERSVHAETVNYRKDGTPYVVAWHISPVHDENGELTHWVSIQRDVSDKQRREERLKHKATHDSLTGLPNRYAIQKQMREHVRASADQDGTSALLYLDLDRFKPVNDEFGHQTGDQVLIRTAEVLRDTVRRRDALGRIGGDEFVICLSGLDDPAEVRSIAERLHAALCEPFDVDGHRIQVQVSIGGAVGLSAYDSVNDALHVADMAMYEAKDDHSEQSVVIRDPSHSRDAMSPFPSPTA